MRRGLLFVVVVMLSLSMAPSLAAQVTNEWLARTMNSMPNFETTAEACVYLYRKNPSHLRIVYFNEDDTEGMALLCRLIDGWWLIEPFGMRIEDMSVYGKIAFADFWNWCPSIVYDVTQEALEGHTSFNLSASPRRRLTPKGSVR